MTHRMLSTFVHSLPLTLSLTTLALVGCSDETSSPDDIGGGGSSQAGAGGTDAGGADPGGASAGGAACVTCAEAISQDGNGELCSDNGPPTSVALLSDLFGCICDDSSGQCAAECADTICCGQTDCPEPDAACVGCISAGCGAEYGACIQDNAASNG